MQVEAMKIRAERERRAWSQEHLAEASGLSLRTVRARGPWARLRYLAAAALLAASLSLFFVRSAHAGDVLLDVGVSLDDEKLGQHQLVAPEGKSAEIKLDGQIRVFINPIVTKEGAILLSMRVEEPAGNGWKQVAEPRLLVASGVEASAKVTSSKGSKFWIAVRPTRM